MKAVWKIAAFGDTHIDHRRRPADTRAVLAQLVSQARERRVDLFVHTGDWFHRKSNPEERNILAEFVRRANEVAPLAGVRGNHDADGDLDIFSALNHAEGDVSRFDDDEIVDRPTVIGLYNPVTDCRIGIGLVPWFSKAGIVAKAAASETIRATDESVMLHARAMLSQAIGVELQRFAASVVVGHLQVSGAETSTGQVLQGVTYELHPDELLDLTGASAIALGHIHKRQEWHSGRVAYTGSTERTNLGEDEPKGWNLLSISPDGRFVSNEFIELTDARRIVLIEVDYTRGEVLRPGEFDVDGAIVRYRYLVSPEGLVGVNETAVREQLGGAYSIKFDPVIAHVERVRDASISLCDTTWAKIEATWAATGVEMTESTRRSIREKYDELVARDVVAAL